MALRTAASPAHEVACRGRRSDRGKPLREREGGGGIPEKAFPKSLFRMMDDRDGAGACGVGGFWCGGGEEKGLCICCAKRGPIRRMRLGDGLREELVDGGGRSRRELVVGESL